MAQPKVFISYRRSDALAQTGRLYDRLNRAFPGMFFRDVSEIGVGVDFENHVERAVGASVALIAVIGPGWANTSEGGKRRLDDADDFVRVEIRTALERKVRIIPVLVGGAPMVTGDELPDDLKPLARWNAITIVEEYYDQGVEKLVRSLAPELGEPASEAAGQSDTTRMKALWGEAEAHIAIDDWFKAIQALQTALKLAPNNFEVAARLKWANEQCRLSGLFTEAQELYEKGKKAAALAKFRQVRVAGGNYRGVDHLLGQIERELATESRRSTVHRWRFGAVAAVVGVVAVVGLLLVRVVRELQTVETVFTQGVANVVKGDIGAVTSGSVSNPGTDPNTTTRPGPAQPVADVPRPAAQPVVPAGTGFMRVVRELQTADAALSQWFANNLKFGIGAVTSGSVSNPGTDSNTTTRPGPAQPVPDVPRPAAQPVVPASSAPAGTGFMPVGRFRAVNHDNQQMAFTLALNPNATFQMQADQSVYRVPLSGGSFTYDPSSGVMLMSGMKNVGGMFSEPMQAYERHDDHFHVMYAGGRWDLFPE